MQDWQAREILKKHAALYGDKQYEPARWVLDAIHEAARVGGDERRIQERAADDGPQPWPHGGMMNDKTTGQGPQQRQVMALRLAAAILVPLLLLCAAVLLSALTRWLEQYIPGKLLMWGLLFALLAFLARAVWKWPEWEDLDAP